MNNSSNRWMTGALLLSMFAIIAVAGTHSAKMAAQASSNVVVTNTAAQAVPVVPAARPSPTGTYIVSVAGTPGVKVTNTASTPVITKDVHDAGSSAFELIVNCDIADGNVENTAGSYLVPSGKRLIVESVVAYSRALSPGNFVTVAGIYRSSTDAVYFPVTPSYQSANFSVGSQQVVMPFDAGHYLSVTVTRDPAASSGLTTARVVIMGHLINYP